MRIETSHGPPCDWQRFVRSVEGAELGHEAPWSTIFHEAYGVEPLHLVARREDGECSGVAPVCIVPGLAGGRRLVSLPYLDTAGVLARDVESEQALLAAIARTADASGCRSVELRQSRPLRGHGTGAARRVAMTLAIDEASEESLWRALPGTVRNQTRKARRSGLAVERAGAEQIDAFYDVHRVRMRELGSPVHARRFFRCAARHFGERARVCVVRYEGEPVGALIAIRHGDAVTVPWASTLSHHNHRCPNNLLYWEALRFAVAGGARRFEFGRSAPGSGTWRFKRGWGAAARPLPWIRLDPAGRVSSARLPESSPALATLSRIWRRLPGPVCDLLGPRVRPRIAS